MLATPVLFIIFNQPEITRRVFEAIRAVRPTRLYIAADGPRVGRAGEAEECVATRAIAELVDWECELRTKFHDTNVGCRANVSSAISWFLDDVDAGIVLEYDCLPHSSFFTYCETLLERYRSDERVFSICGSNLQFGERRGDGDYFFAHLPNTWGWATWKRAWQTWDGDLPGLPQFLAEGQLDNFVHTTSAKRHLQEKLLDVHERRNTTTWGFGWVFAHLRHDAVSIYPNVNLVSNLGFGGGATHASDSESVFSRIPLVAMESFRPPSFPIPSIEADECVIRWALHQPWRRRIATRLRAAIVGAIPKQWHASLKKRLRPRIQQAP